MKGVLQGVHINKLIIRIDFKLSLLKSIWLLWSQFLHTTSRNPMLDYSAHMLVPMQISRVSV